jgi:ribosome modulation factor
MIESNELSWPFVHVLASGQVDVVDAVELHAAFDRFLARGRRFGIVLDARASLPTPSPAAAALRTRWVGSRRQAMADRCAGIAAVALPSLVQRIGAHADRLTREVYGCAGGAFATVDEAEAWLSQRLYGPSGAA